MSETSGDKDYKLPLMDNDYDHDLEQNTLSNPEYLNEKNQQPEQVNPIEISNRISRIGLLKGLFQSSIGEWILILSLIFGGCCSTIYASESIISEFPNTYSIITFFQFFFVALEGYIHFFDSSNPPLFIKKSKVPLKRWIINVLLYFIVSLMNNIAFGLNISVPLHIIFRSSGVVTTTIVGYIMGRRYSKKQILASIILTLGVIAATLSSSESSTKKAIDLKTKNLSSDSTEIKEIDEFKELLIFYFGIGVLFTSSILMSIMALYLENTYKLYGKHWRENLFFQHFLALPFFLFISKSAIKQFMDLWNSEPPININFLTILFKGFFGKEIYLSKQILNLLLLTATQYMCIRGVQNLAGNTTALTVMIILNIRKFTSLLLSIWIFGNPVNGGIIIGTVLVFYGAYLYSQK